MSIHPTAVVHEGAEIHSTADIGPYCVVGSRAKIGPQTRLISHVVVHNATTIGARNVIYPFASLGSDPQDLKYRGEPARLLIGDDNRVREGVTMSIGTEGGHMETRLGNHCLLMAYSHVAHDCRLGNHVILANSVGLAGHIDVGDHAILGGLSGVHQFCRVGAHAFLAGGAIATQDVPPYCIAQGDRAKLVGVNAVGLRRAGWTRDRIGDVREGFKRLFHTDNTRLVALEITERELAPRSPDVTAMCEFIRHSNRGICAPRIGLPNTDPYEG